MRNILIFDLTNENECGKIISVLVFDVKNKNHGESEGDSMEKTTYHTVGREKLLSYFAEHPGQQLTVEELTQELAREQVSVGKSTVYRLVGKLYEEGKLKRTHDAARGCHTYSYAEDTHDCDGHHFHLKCLGCGRLFHLECRHSETLCEHIEEIHHFRIDSSLTAFYGQCEACLRKART